jgi:hypothetical protein
VVVALVVVSMMHLEKDFIGMTTFDQNKMPLTILSTTRKLLQLYEKQVLVL